MTEAIFGLVGVLIGGLLNGGISWLAERRRLKGDVRVAARLVVSEVEMNQVATKTALASSNLGQLTFGKVEEWKKRRETLASVLPDEEWSGIDNYFLFFEHMSSSMLTQAVDDEVKESLRTLLTKGRSSLAALRRYAGEKVRIIEKLDDSDEEQPDQ